MAAQLRTLLLPDGSINEAAVAALGLDLEVGGDGAAEAAAEPDLDALLSLEGVDIGALFGEVDGTLLS